MHPRRPECDGLTRWVCENTRHAFIRWWSWCSERTSEQARASSSWVGMLCHLSLTSVLSRNPGFFHLLPSVPIVWTTRRISDQILSVHEILDYMRPIFV